MPNKASNQLFLLIKSMSKQEKRYFRIFSSRHSNEKNNYYTLYQVIDRQDDYDEEAIIQLLKSHQFVNRLSIAKTRLYDQILKSLSSFHATKSIDSELFFTLQSIEILYSRALYKAAWKKLKSGYKIAEKHEKQAILLQLNKWKKRLIEKENYQSLDIEHIDQWRDNERSILKQIKEYNTLWYVKSKLFKVLFYGGENSAKNQLQIQLLMEENVYPLNKDRLSERAKFLYHHIYSAFHFAKNELDQSFTHLSKNLEILEKNNWLFSENPYSEISILSNMSYIGIKLNKKEDIKPILERMKKWNKELQNADENLKIRWFYSYYSIYLTQRINENNCDLLALEIENIQDGLSTYSEKIPLLRKSDLKMLLSIFYHKAGQHRLALKTVHDLLNDLNSKQNASLYFTARFFYLTLLIELDKKDYFEVAWLSTKRLLKSGNYSNEERDSLSSLFDAYHKYEIDGLINIYPNLEKNWKNENPFFSFKEWVVSKSKSSSNSALAS